MAQDDTLMIWQATQGQPTETDTAQLLNDEPVTGSTPSERFLVWAFSPDTPNEHIDFFGIMPQHYAGGGVTIRLRWGAATANTGNVRWGAAFRELLTTDDTDSSHSYSYQEFTDAAPGTLGAYEDTAGNISFTDGGQMDSVGAGDLFILRLRREASDTTNDTMAGDAYLLMVEMRES